MKFSDRKLPPEAAATLRQCPQARMRPFVAMPSPVYLFLKANAKFVAVKGPLDFFTPAELERFTSMGALFLPEFIDAVAPFAEAGRRLKALLNAPETSVAAEAAPYETSDASLRILSELWGAGEAGLEVESFFVCLFVTELLGPLPENLMVEAYDRDVTLYERAMLFSSWICFLALHLGYFDPKALMRSREGVFSSISRGAAVSLPDELGELVAVIAPVLADEARLGLRAGDFRDRPERIAQKLCSRLTRIEEQLVKPDRACATIMGERGFLRE